MKGSVLGRRFEYTMDRDSPITSAEWHDLANKHQAMVKWCNEHFNNWGQEGYTFWFMYEKDYTLFLLRWA